MAEEYDEILVVDLLGGIGDLLMVLPAIHALARRHPQAAVRVLTHEPGADLVRQDPLVAEVRVPRCDASGAERQAVAEALAEVRPDLAVTTTRYDGIPDLLREGSGRCIDDLWRDPPPDQEVGARYLEILADEGVVDPAERSARPRVHLERDELDQGRKLLASLVPGEPTAPPVVLVPQAGMAVKRWPDRHWARLTAELSERGHRLLSVTEPMDDVVTLLPAMSLRELAAFFAAVAEAHGSVVGGDTGPLRLATAAGARTVALFGPTSALRYGMGGGADLQGLPGCHHRRPTAITEQVCWWDATCPLSPEGPACMAALTSEAVADQVRAR